MKLADEILKNINNNYLQVLASLTDLLDASKLQHKLKTIILLPFWIIN
jgi:hypothetical protein